MGREREIDHGLMQAELAGDAHAEGRGTQGATLVITGCPGSGKSADTRVLNGANTSQRFKQQPGV